ncbi:MAG: leucyl aminopeptidase, partial [Gallicola sp.]|nr:leucyl aminopeptidase [Gallicola sp.]
VLATKAVEELTKYDVDVKVYNKKQIEEMGLKAFLEVGKGSEKEPKFIVMEYFKGGEKKPLAFVGKGLTYDSGGYSLKPTDSMNYMFSDMGGAGTVIGALSAIAKNKLKVNVVGVIAACENLISGRAYKPGDIIDSLSGKKIEVDNTDAEGRITLADAVYYTADNYDPKILVDLATLTGACLIALGERYTGVVSNSDFAFGKVQEASDIANEKIWRLPNDPAYKEQYKSKSADYVNTGGRFAGTITAAQFVGEFNKDVDWVHMDIAGTAYLSKEFGCYPKGATGVHVKTLYNLAKMYSWVIEDEESN